MDWIRPPLPFSCFHDLDILYFWGRVRFMFLLFILFCKSTDHKDLLELGRHDLKNEAFWNWSTTMISRTFDNVFVLNGSNQSSAFVLRFPYLQRSWRTHIIFPLAAEEGCFLLLFPRRKSWPGLNKLVTLLSPRVFGSGPQYSKQSLHFRDKTKLIMTDNLLYMFIFCFKIFYWEYIHQKYWPAGFFLCAFTWFWKSGVKLVL